MLFRSAAATGSVVELGDAGAPDNVGEGLGWVADATAASEPSGDAPPAMRFEDGVAWFENFPPIAEPRATTPIKPITPTATSRPAGTDRARPGYVWDGEAMRGGRRSVIGAPS